MPTREQIRRLIDGGLDYAAAGERLGIPPGQAYLIATGRPADGGDTPATLAGGPGDAVAGSQRLANPPPQNPAGSKSVRDWIAARVAADTQMRTAGGRQAGAEAAAPSAPA